jgi:hypothetical protein
MSGSWEILKQTQVLVVILTRETVSTAWSIGFRNLIIPGTYTFLTGMPFDHARNAGCEKVLELDFQWLFFLDDDVIPPSDTILRLMSHNKPIVSGIYYRRSPPILPVMLNKTSEGKKWISEYKVPDLLEVDFVGAGCILIHSDVFRKISRPWFEWKVDRYDLPIEDRLSEDFSFCELARKSGYKILVDTSIHCRHIGLGESRIGSQYIPSELIV